MARYARLIEVFRPQGRGEQQEPATQAYGRRIVGERSAAALLAAARQDRRRRRRDESRRGRVLDLQS